jgi:hypothetical protein
MKRLSVFWIAILAITSASLEAQAQSRPISRRAPRPDVPIAANFLWLHYGADPFIPDSLMPRLEGGDNIDPNQRDVEQLKRIMRNDPGYEKANEIARVGLASVLAGQPATTPLALDAPTMQQFRNGAVEQICVKDGEQAGDYMVFGLHVVTPTQKDLRLERNVINRTGGLVCGLTTRDSVEVTPGVWKRPVIYRQCRNLAVLPGTPVRPTATVIPPPSIQPTQQAAAAPPPPSPVLIVAPVRKDWLNKKGERINPPKHYFLNLRAFDQETGNQLGQLQLQDISAGAFDRMPSGRRIRITEDPVAGWQSRGDVYYMVGSTDETPMLLNQKTDGGGFHFSCGPAKGIYCWGPLAALGGWLIWDKTHSNPYEQPPNQTEKGQFPSPTRPGITISF